MNIGNVAPTGTHTGIWTLNDGRSINYSISSQWTGSIYSPAHEINTVTQDSTGSIGFAPGGSEMFFVTGVTGSTGYTITFDVRNMDSSNLVFGVAHLYQHNQVQIFGVPNGGVLAADPTTGLVSLGGSTHYNLSDWTTYRAPTSGENSSVNASFINPATVIEPSATTPGLEKYVVYSPSGSGVNTTYQFVQTGPTDKLDYVSMRFDLNPASTGNTERWNLTVGSFTTVPEPSIAVLGVLGTLCGVFRRRR